LALKVKMAFDGGYDGILTAKKGSARIGGDEGSLAPYDMILGGLGACLKHTLQTILDKKRIEIGGVNFEIEGEKRSSSPTTLKEVVVEATVSNAKQEDEANIEKAFEIATRHCSVYQTLAEVALMRANIRFRQS